MRFFARTSLSTLAFARLLALHVGHNTDMPPQRMNRLIMRFSTRYEHIAMRVLCWLATRNWIQHPFMKRGIDRLTRMVINVVSGEVLSLDEGREMVNVLFDSGATVAVGTCPCRRARGVYSSKVSNETDMVFGKWAREYLANYPEFYKEITRDEALDMLEKFDKCGLVRQVYGFNETNASTFVMCNCAEEVCIPMLAMRRIGVTAFEKGRSRARVDEELCKGTAACGICLARCSFAARLPEGKAAVIEEKCMGCGLCVTGCPSGASSLRRVPGAELHYAKELLDG